MLIGVADICIPETLSSHTLSNTMNYNIRIEFRDGTVEKFDRKSNIKPLNSHKLNDKIFHEYCGWDTIKEITSTPILT